jgi:hypothetical protein
VLDEIANHGARLYRPNMPAGPDTTRAMAVSPAGNTVVRNFIGSNIPPRWQQEGTMLDPGDPTQSTPPLQAFGNILRQGTAQGLPQFAQMAPLAIPGAGLIPTAVRAGAGFLGGAAANAGSRALMGQPQSLGASAMAGGINAGGQLLGDVAAPAVLSQASRFAKASLGNSLPGMEQTLLAAKTPVSNSGMQADQAFIDQKVKEAQSAIMNSGRRFSPATLENTIKAMRDRAAQYDMLSENGQGSLDNALTVLQKKVDQYYQPHVQGDRPAGQRRGFISADQLNEINQYAEDAAKKLFDARTANKSVDPGPLESAYKRIADVTNSMLNTIPEVKAANMAASQRINLKNAKFNSLQRTPPKLLPLVMGEGVGQTAQALTHNPWMLATGIPAAGLAYAASTPSGLSQLGFSAQDPFIQQLLRASPRFAAGALNGMMGQDK